MTPAAILRAMFDAVFALVLLSALMNAAWNGIIKVRVERVQAMGITALVAAALSLPVFVGTGLPSASSWGWLLLSVAVHTAYHFALPLAYRHGELGQVYPIARGTAPLVVLVAAALLAGDPLAPAQGAGVVLLCAGVLGLSLAGSDGVVRRSTLAFALLTGLLVAAYTVIDGVGSRASRAPLAYGAAMTVGGGFVTAALLAAWKGTSTFRVDKATWIACTQAAALQLGATWIALWAFTQAPLAVVSALRETSVLWVAVLSGFVLKERFGPLRVTCTSLVLAGLFVIRAAA